MKPYNYEDLLSYPGLSTELDRELATRRLGEFIRQAWPVIEPGTRFVPGWHIDAICEHLEAISQGQIRLREHMTLEIEGIDRMYLGGLRTKSLGTNCDAHGLRH